MNDPRPELRRCQSTTGYGDYDVRVRCERPMNHDGMHRSQQIGLHGRSWGDASLRSDVAPPKTAESRPYALSAGEVRELADALSWASSHPELEVRVMWDGGLKVDVSDGAGWTINYGTETGPTGHRMLS